MFLGTPFRGSWEEGYYMANCRYYTHLKAGLECSPQLLQYLRPDGRSDADGGPSPLNEMVHRFTEIMNNLGLQPKIVCFYETRQTDFAAHLKHLPPGQVKINVSGHAVVILPPHPTYIIFYTIYTYI